MSKEIKLSDYEHVIGLERLNKSLSKKVTDLEKDLSIRTRHLMVRNNELKTMFQEEKALRLQAEKEAKEFVTFYGEQNDALLNRVAELENKLKGKLQ